MEIHIFMTVPFLQYGGTPCPPVRIIRSAPVFATLKCGFAEASGDRPYFSNLWERLLLASRRILSGPAAISYLGRKIDRGWKAAPTSDITFDSIYQNKLFTYLWDVPIIIELFKNVPP